MNEYWENFFKEYWNRPSFKEMEKIRNSKKLSALTEKEAITILRGGIYYKV